MPKTAWRIFKLISVVIGLLIILALIYLGIQYYNNKNRHTGGLNPNSGDWCDYGFNIKRGQCCDEDDYSCEMCAYKDFDCYDFKNQSDAQAYFDECKNYYFDKRDIHNLDGDSDGITCETLKKE